MSVWFIVGEYKPRFHPDASSFTFYSSWSHYVVNKIGLKCKMLISNAKENMRDFVKKTLKINSEYMKFYQEPI